MVTVKTGGTVTWTFADNGIAHDVTGDGFKSATMTNGTYSHTFDKAGTYAYDCTIHPFMKGKVEVTG